jgi:hypothetical protein
MVALEVDEAEVAAVHERVADSYTAIVAQAVPG